MGAFPSAILSTLFTTHKLPLAECPAGLRRNVNQWSSKNKDDHQPFVYYSDPSLPDYLAEHCGVPGRSWETRVKWPKSDVEVIQSYQCRAVSIIVARKAKRGLSMTTVALTVTVPAAASSSCESDSSP